MTLPHQLQQAIEQEIHSLPIAQLQQAAKDLSLRYRQQQRAGQGFFGNTAHRIAYLATRLPATYAAVSAVLDELQQRHPQFTPKTMLDVGAGPGTASWAVAEKYHDIGHISLFEADAPLLAIGKRLAAAAEGEALRQGQWIQGDLAKEIPGNTYDLIVCSYSLGELTSQRAMATVTALWKQAQVIVVIEPGTRLGFERVLECRRLLIGEGAHLLAPCPHASSCPLAAIGDWCHFPTRLERSNFHRLFKEGTLGYEDEKFSYVVASKTAGSPAETRIVRHPLKRSGHIHVELCTPEGLKKELISKRQGARYRQAKKAEWGDEITGSVDEPTDYHKNSEPS